MKLSCNDHATAIFVRHYLNKRVRAFELVRGGRMLKQNPEQPLHEQPKVRAEIRRTLILNATC